MSKQQLIFFDLLQFCISNRTDIPSSLKDADWRILFETAQKQALLGVIFYGIQQLPKEVAPKPTLLMKWLGTAQHIKQMNARLFQDSVKVTRLFKEEGFRCCILKGQGNALMFPDPYMRTPGDIDILVVPSNENLEKRRAKIIRYVNGKCPGQTVRYHHIDFPIMKTPIEVHFTPSYMFCPIHNHRMQKWFDRMMYLQCSNVVQLSDGFGDFAVPTTSFNIIYILSHLYRHLFTEGIGLRQLLDYYFVLEKWYKRPHPKSDLTAIQRDLKWLGLWKFAKAVMYVVHESFGLSEDKMIAPMDKKEGMFLIDEIMRGGNFGQYDDRLGDKTGEGKVHRYFRMSLRNMRFVKHYPSEAICEPLFRTWFWTWRKKKWKSNAVDCKPLTWIGAILKAFL